MEALGCLVGIPAMLVGFGILLLMTIACPWLIIVWAYLGYLMYLAYRQIFCQADRDSYAVSDSCSDEDDTSSSEST